MNSFEMNGTDFNDNLLCDEKLEDEEIPRVLEKFAARKGTKRPMSQMDISDSDDSSSSDGGDDQPDLGMSDECRHIMSFLIDDIGDYYANLIDECFEAYFISLGDYFSEWNISRRDQIHLCRAYASYLAVQDKSINKKEKK